MRDENLTGQAVPGTSFQSFISSPVAKTCNTVILVLLTALTALALWRHGYWGILAPNFLNFAAFQVFADLVIALLLLLVWMWFDARETGRRFWPWLLLTLAAGSYGPFLYLLFGKRRKQREP